MCRIVIVCMLASMFVNAGDLQFKDISARAKLDIENAFVSNVLASSICIVRQSSEDFLYSPTRALPCSKRQFYYLGRCGLIPCRDVFDVLGNTRLDISWIVKMSTCGGRASDKCRFHEKYQGLYRPTLAHDDMVLLTFLNKGANYEKLVETASVENNGCEDELVSCAKQLCQNNTAVLIDNLTYAIDVGGHASSGICGVNEFERECLEVHKRMSLHANAASPAIKLSRKEASEFVYVVALCKRVVFSAARFNERFVGSGNGYLVKVPDCGCVTEFGKRMYSAAVKHGLISNEPKVSCRCESSKRKHPH